MSGTTNRPVNSRTAASRPRCSTGVVAIGDALALGRGHAALFVADTGRLALVFRADCAPLLSIRL